MALNSTIYSRVTDQIVAALEVGIAKGSTKCPWHGAQTTQRPSNAQSGKAYRGINILALWAAAEGSGFSSGTWATYKQWAELGAQVRKGEKATQIVFWKKLEARDDDDGADDGEAKSSKSRMMARAYSVFNVAQVDGFVAAPAPAPLGEDERNLAAEFWVAGVGADIGNGPAAYYMPSQDKVVIPPFASFRDGVAYYSVLAHELVHWTGAAKRLDRKLSVKFGSSDYAAEELIAELGAAFTCAILGLSSEPRADHASYLASWLRCLKDDPKAIFTAAGMAQRAVDYLEGVRPGDAAALAGLTDAKTGLTGPKIGLTVPAQSSLMLEAA